MLNKDTTEIHKFFFINLSTGSKREETFKKGLIIKGFKFDIGFDNNKLL